MYNMAVIERVTVKTPVTRSYFIVFSSASFLFRNHMAPSALPTCSLIKDDKQRAKYLTMEPVDTAAHPRQGHTAMRARLEARGIEHPVHFAPSLSAAVLW